MLGCWPEAVSARTGFAAAGYQCTFPPGVGTRRVPLHVRQGVLASSFGAMPTTLKFARCTAIIAVGRANLGAASASVEVE